MLLNKDLDKKILDLYLDFNINFSYLDSYISYIKKDKALDLSIDLALAILDSLDKKDKALLDLALIDYNKAKVKKYIIIDLVKPINYIVYLIDLFNYRSFNLAIANKDSYLDLDNYKDLDNFIL